MVCNVVQGCVGTMPSHLPLFSFGAPLKFIFPVKVSSGSETRTSGNSSRKVAEGSQDSEEVEPKATVAFA